MRSLLGTIAVIAAAGWSSSAVAQDTQCQTNFETEGSFFSGRSYSSWAVDPAVSTGEAFRRAYTALVREGWRIQTSDREMGVISAATDVQWSDNRTAPLNVLVEPFEGSGSRLTVTFSIHAGAMMRDAETSFCEIMATLRSSG